MAKGKYPPTLDIPVSDSFRDLKEVQATLMYDEPKPYENRYGKTGYRYSVMHNGEEHTLFASEALKRQMDEHGPVKGTTLSFARVGQGKDTRWDVVYVSGPQGEPGGSREAPSTGGSGPAPRKHDPAGFKKELDRYLNAMDLAIKHLGVREIPIQADTNAVAFVIYKMAQDYGIEDPMNPGEAGDDPSSTEDAEKQGKGKMWIELERAFKATGLHETQWMAALQAHAPEGVEIASWDDVTRDVGLAAYATAKNVEDGNAKWSDLVSPGESEFPPEDDVPF